MLAADAERIEHIAFAVALAFRNGWTSTHATFVFHVPLAIARSRQNVETAALKNGTRASANSTFILNLARAIIRQS